MKHGNAISSLLQHWGFRLVQFYTCDNHKERSVVAVLVPNPTEPAPIYSIEDFITLFTSKDEADLICAVKLFIECEWYPASIATTPEDSLRLLEKKLQSIPLADTKEWIASVLEYNDSVITGILPGEYFPHEAILQKVKEANWFNYAKQTIPSS